MQKKLWTSLLSFAALTQAGGGASPQAQISRGPVRATIALPDAKNGFYRGTRFDWSGVITDLEANGHRYYGRWFTKTDPSVHDFIYDGADIVAGTCSAATGPVEEYAPVGWDEAKQGGSFLKIGVGVLRKEGDAYDNYHVYRIANGGSWRVRHGHDQVEFIQELTDRASGFGYTYRKYLRLTETDNELVLEHVLRNTGKRAIHTNVYNHNFLVLDRQGPGPGLTISLPFGIQTQKPPDKSLAVVDKNQIRYMKTLVDKDTVAMPITGFGSSASDNKIRIESVHAGAGMTIETDRPLWRESLWSIRTVVAMEPFIVVDVKPGAEFSWKTTYTYYTLHGAKH